MKILLSAPMNKHCCMPVFGVKGVSLLLRVIEEVPDKELLNYIHPVFCW